MRVEDRNKEEKQLSEIENEDIKKELETYITHYRAAMNQLRINKEKLEQEQKKRERLEKITNNKEYILLKDLDNENNNLKAELETYITHYRAAMDQVRYYQEELVKEKQRNEEFQNATFWRMTGPMRKIVAKIQNSLNATRTGRRIYKGFVSLKKEGVRATWMKVTLCLSEKRQLQVFGEQFHLDKEERKRQEETVFSRNITFSILVPLYNTPIHFLKEMIESVEFQTYSGWELCLADGSDRKHNYVERYCRKKSRENGRIRYQRLEKNEGISENTNHCIDMAHGDYIALFDHDDLLHPSVLYEMMKVIEDSNADFIYTDEATFEKKISNIITAHFKPDYAVDTLRGNNYICHFSAFHRDLLKKAGRFRKEYDGSQDHDLILRLTAKAKRIEHIPKILYYWRSHPNSVAADINSKTYAIEAGKKAVRDSIRAAGLEAEVESSKAFPTIYRIRYLIKRKELVSIIIPNKNHLSDIRRCVQSILTYTTYPNYEILIIDNGSTDREVFSYYGSLQSDKKVRILHWNQEFNYSAINNYGIREARGEYIILLNNDTKVITPEWIEEMLMYAQRKEVGAVGAKLYYEDDTIQHAGIIIGMGTDGVAGHAHYRQPKENLGYMGRLYYAQNMSAVTAACLMVRKCVYEKVHGLDEGLGVAYNDVDFCMKLRKKGYLNVFTPYAELYHYESRSRGAEDTPEKKRRFQQEAERFKRRWKKELEKGDPYFNPNFRLDRDDFTIKG